MADKILITGGAGYIGSHLAKNLLEKNYEVIVFDNLSAGFNKPLAILKKKFKNLTFICGDLSDRPKLDEIFRSESIEAVMHLAAKIYVDESVANPGLYHRENYLNSVNLVEAMLAAGVGKIIFSSTAAIYGNPRYAPIDEKHPANPLSPYGQTKLDFEKYLAKIDNLHYVILRYFNVGGADHEGLIGKSHLLSQDILENIIKTALGQKEYFKIFGNDYPTADGTAVRDLVHVEDIAQAHILSLEQIGRAGREVFNLGSENGFSVKEIIAEAEKIIGRKIAAATDKRREGDPAVSIASAKKAKDRLGWRTKYDLAEIIRTDWQWRQRHPLGYTK